MALDREHIVALLRVWEPDRIAAECGGLEIDFRIPEIKAIRLVVPEGMNPWEARAAFHTGPEGELHPDVLNVEWERIHAPTADWGTAIGASFRVRTGGTGRTPALPAELVESDMVVLRTTTTVTDVTGYTLAGTGGPYRYWFHQVGTSPAAQPSLPFGQTGFVFAIRGYVANSGSPFVSFGLWNGTTNQATVTVPGVPANDGQLALAACIVGGDLSEGFAVSGPATTPLTNGLYIGPVGGGTTGDQVFAISEWEDGYETWISGGFITLRAASTLVAEPGVPYYQCSNDPLTSFEHVRMGVFRGWRHTRGDPAVKVVVVDTGIRAHPDLPDLSGPNQQWDELTDVPDATETVPEGTHGHNHGSAVLGIMGAKRGNAIGSAGIVPDCTFGMIRAAGNSGTFIGIFATNAIIRAARAIGNDNGLGADIINCSFGGDNSQAAYNAAGQYVVDQGAIIFAAAGNETADLDLAANDYGPAESTGFVTVGATSNGTTDEPASYTNYGTPIEIVAPPTFSVPEPNLIVENGGYSIFNGTSGASPACAAVAAGIKSVNRSLSRQQILDILFGTADVGRHASFAAKFPNAGVANFDKACSAAAATAYPDTPIPYQAFTNDSELIPWQCTTVQSGVASTQLAGAIRAELGGYIQRQGQTTLLDPVALCELWVGETCVFAGPPQTIKVTGASNGAVYSNVTVKTRGGNKSVIEEFNDVKTFGLTLTQSVPGFAAVASMPLGNASIVYGSKVPGRTVTVNGAPVTETSTYTWEATVFNLTPGLNEITVADGVAAPLTLTVVNSMEVPVADLDLVAASPSLIARFTTLTAASIGSGAFAPSIAGLAVMPMGDASLTARVVSFHGNVTAPSAEFGEESFAPSFLGLLTPPQGGVGLGAFAPHMAVPIEKNLFYFDGSAWRPVELYRFDGAEWIAVG